MAHAYVVSGESEQGIGAAEGFAESTFGIASHGDPDLIVLRYTLFSVDDARKLSDLAHAAPIGEHKVIVISATRFFHEAQNALLKLFEEPPSATTLILVVSSEGMLLPTLRSRLQHLPQAVKKKAAVSLSPLGAAFLAADDEEREKLVAKLVDRSKADRDEDKQRARSEAIALAEDLMRAADNARTQAKGSAEAQAYRIFLEDLTAFLPLLHTRSAPLKLIFEHLLLVIPKGLRMAEV